MADIAGVSKDTVLRKVKELYPDRVKNGKATTLIQTEAIHVMKELRKKNFVEPLQNAEVATQNAKVGLNTKRTSAKYRRYKNNYKTIHKNYIQKTFIMI